MLSNFLDAQNKCFDGDLYSDRWMVARLVNLRALWIIHRLTALYIYLMAVASFLKRLSSVD